MKLPFFYCFFPQPSRKTLKTWQKKKIHAAFCFTTRRKEKHWKHTFNRLYTLVRSVLLNYFDLTSVIQSCDTIGGKIYQVPGNISPICPERKNGMTWLFCQCQRAETFHILETAEGRQITHCSHFSGSPGMLKRLLRYALNRNTCSDFGNCPTVFTHRTFLFSFYSNG